jgi:hypothetical protein
MANDVQPQSKLIGSDRVEGTAVYAADGKKSARSSGS